MSRNEEQTQLIRDERKDQILKAALKVFASKGLAAAKISDIASTAKLSYGLVYHYFMSKEDVFTELVKQTLDISNESSKKLLLAPGDAYEKLVYIAKANTIDNHTEENAFRWLIMTQAVILDTVPGEVRELVTKSSHLQQNLAGIIAQGQKEGKIVPGDPNRLATAFLALIQGLIFSKAYGEDVAPIPEADMIAGLFKAH